MKAGVYLGQNNNCETADVQRVLSLYAAIVTNSHTAGVTLYQENITECVVGHENDMTYQAVVEVNDVTCLFSLSHNRVEKTLHLVTDTSIDLPGCETISLFN